MRLFLVSHGSKLAIAGFLGPAEKESFAKALSARHRRGEARTDAQSRFVSAEIGWFGATVQT